MQTKNLQSALPSSEGKPEVLLGGPQDGISLPHSRLQKARAGVHPYGAPDGPAGVLEVERFRVQLVAHPPAERMKFLQRPGTGSVSGIPRIPMPCGSAAIEKLTGMDRQTAMKQLKSTGWIDAPGYAFRGVPMAFCD